MPSEKAKGKRPVGAPLGENPAPIEKTAQEETADDEASLATKTALSNAKDERDAQDMRWASFKPVRLAGDHWLSTESREGPLAAYLGFSNTSDLRKFAISWVCLAAEEHFQKWAFTLPKKGLFWYLSQKAFKKKFTEVTTAPETVWPYRQSDIKNRRNIHKRIVVAWSLYRMAYDVHVYKTSTKEENEKRTILEQAKFLARHAREVSNQGLSFPSEMVGFPAPNLGPLYHLNEGELEVYNRCWEVVRYLWNSYHTHNWKTRFGKVEALDQGITVSQSDFPPWMRSSDTQTISNLMALRPKSATGHLPPLKISLHWVRDHLVRRYEETERAIQKAKSRGIMIPPLEQELPWDPRLCVSGSQFMNQIRRLMCCEELKLDVQELRLRYRDNVLRIDRDRDPMHDSWDRLRGYMLESTNTSFSLWLRLEPFDTRGSTYRFVSMREERAVPKEIPKEIEDRVLLLSSAAADQGSKGCTNYPAVVEVRSALEQSPSAQHDDFDSNDYASSKRLGCNEEQRK